MIDRDVVELPPEVLEAFLGKARLGSVRGHFPSRASMLHAYASLMTTAFGGQPTDRESQCGICSGAHNNRAMLVVAWKARIRLHWARIAAYILLFPLRVCLLLHQPTESLQAPLVHSFFAEHARFKTVHPLCADCERKVRQRGLCYTAYVIWGTIAAITSGAIAGLAGTGVLLRLLGCFGAQPQDARKVLPVFIWSSCALISTIVLWILARRHLLPKPLRRLVKRPFVFESREIHRL